MSLPCVTDTASTQSKPAGFGLWLQYGENLLVSFALAAMMILPLAEIVLRKTLHVGLVGSSAFVQHFTLAVGVLGGAIAAREGRLLSLSTLAGLLKGKWKTAATIFSNSFASAITVFLCVASFQFVLSEKQSGNKLAYDIPVWIIQTILPIGFALVTWRLIRHASEKWRGRAIAILLAGLFVWIASRPPFEPAKMVVPALIGLVIATVLGAPVFTTLGGAALILFWGDGSPIASIPLDHYRLVTNPSLPAIPLFTLAGYFLAEEIGRAHV